MKRGGVNLAQVLGRMGAVIFSVDGLSDTNHLYRQGVVWDNVERNMRAFYRCRRQSSLGLFNL